MKITDPFDMEGYLKVEGNYRVGKQTGKLSPNSMGLAYVQVPVAWKPDAPFEIELEMKVEYELSAKAQDFWDTMVHLGSGEFGALASWRASQTEDGLELKSSGSLAQSSPKSKGDIAVTAGGAFLSESFKKGETPFIQWKAFLVGGLKSRGIGFGYAGASTTVGGDTSAGKTQPITFRVSLDVEKPPAKPEKKPPAIKVMKFKVGPYEHKKTQTDEIKRSSLSGYYTWAELKVLITKLPQATLDEWSAGKPKILGAKSIKITGYTDTTGPMSENDMKYGKGRADDVKNWIQTWTGVDNSFFLVKSAGEGKGGTDKKADEKKLAQNRYVDVELSYIQ
jgi:OmpA family protein